ncbi:MAG: histidine phosphatase family protein [Candidatus Poribacteria bacterium]
MRLYLVRHGQSTQNRGDLDAQEAPLTRLGLQQAEWAGEALRYEGIHRLYCSPMRRAVQTAARISDALDMPPRVRPELCEYGGIWPVKGADGPRYHHGMTRAELLAICPSAETPESITDRGWWFHKFTPPCDDSLRHARDSARRLLAELAETLTGDEDRAALVGHGGILDIIICEALGYEPNGKYIRLMHDNGAISRVDVEYGQTRVAYMNRIDHLRAGHRSA